MMPEKTRKGVRFASFSAIYRDGNLVHTGGVTGSIPVSPTTKTRRKPSLSDRTREFPMDELNLGYVYFATFDFETVKVGFATDVRSRLLQMQVSSPVNATRIDGIMCRWFPLR